MSIPGRCGSWAVVVVLGVMLPQAAGATSMSTRIEKDRITILAEGVKPSEKFALVFSREAASIVGWYNLDRDPRMEVNLCAHGPTNGFALFQNRAEMLLDGKEVAVFPGPADAFSVTESSDVRVVVEVKGVFATPSGEFPGETFNKEVFKFTGQKPQVPERPRYETRFVVYPTGRVYIRHLWDQQGFLPVVLTSNRIILGTAPAVGVTALNDHAEGARVPLFEPASFLLHTGTEEPFRASALLVVNYRKYSTDWVGQMMTMERMTRGWTRSAFTVVRGRQFVHPGKYLWQFMLQIEPLNTRDVQTARLYASDYLEPARITFAESRGSLAMPGADDEQMDGFAEGRGCYVVSADARPVLDMHFNAGMHARFHPAFEIECWKHPVPTVIVVDEYRRHIGEHYNAHLDKERLVIQYLGVLSPGEHTLVVSGQETGEQLSD